MPRATRGIKRSRANGTRHTPRKKARGAGDAEIDENTPIGASWNSGDASQADGALFDDMRVDDQFHSDAFDLPSPSRLRTHELNATTTVGNITAETYPRSPHRHTSCSRSSESTPSKSRRHPSGSSSVAAARPPDPPARGQPTATTTIHQLPPPLPSLFNTHTARLHKSQYALVSRSTSRAHPPTTIRGHVPPTASPSLSFPTYDPSLFSGGPTYSESMSAQKDRGAPRYMDPATMHDDRPSAASGPQFNLDPALFDHIFESRDPEPESDPLEDVYDGWSDLEDIPDTGHAYGRARESDNESDCESLDMDDDFPDMSDNLRTEIEREEQLHTTSRISPISRPRGDPNANAPLSAPPPSVPAHMSTAHFVPLPHPSGHYYPPPSRETALRTAELLTAILQPTRLCGKGHKKFPFGCDDLLRRRLEMMRMFLWLYSDEKRHLGWREASEDVVFRWAAGSHKKSQWSTGQYGSRQLRQWARSFIDSDPDDPDLPFNLYGTWNTSLLEDGDLAREIHEHLQSLGPYVRAQDVVDFINKPRIRKRYRLNSSISLRTAQRWMHMMNYRWTKRPKGQYVDGHEREDVVAYRQTHYLPRLAELSENMRAWKDGVEEARGGPRARFTVIWYHDESTFYANDRRIIRWVHKDEKAVPLPKGEGLSLMVVDFVSADYGWLRSKDGKRCARELFRAGKGRQGYYTNEDIVRQAEKAITILQRDYPEDDHVLVYDNASTHTKRPDGALSAKGMRVNPTSNFHVTRAARDPDTGQRLYSKNGEPLREEIQMTGAYFNGDPTRPQSLYFPADYADRDLRGLFKGMRIILAERDIKTQGLKGQCGKHFDDCPPGRKDCCMRRILYNQPDFVAVESVLETRCRELGIPMLLLPKFHPELNPIEQCWGHAKRRYRELPRSKKDDDLERNVVAVLDSVPIESIRKFVVRSSRFADAYRHRLNGEEAAWAVKKYRGHRVLPERFMDDMPERLKGKRTRTTVS